MTGDATLSSRPEVQPATVGEWFACLQPSPPAVLGEELQKLVAHAANRPAVEVPEVCLETAERLLEQLMRSGSTDRATALTLLAVDSLVTYAFQAASSDPSQMETRSANAMKRIAELAEQAA